MENLNSAMLESIELLKGKENLKGVFQISGLKGAFELSDLKGVFKISDLKGVFYTSD